MENNFENPQFNQNPTAGGTNNGANPGTGYTGGTSTGSFTENPNGYGTGHSQSYGAGYSQSYGAENQNGYGSSNPYGNPNASQNGGYRAPQYGNTYNPQYGYRPQNAYNPQNAYTSRGYYYPPQSQYDPFSMQKGQQKKEIRLLSNVHGLTVLGFSLFAFVLSFLLVKIIPSFSVAYKHNMLFRTAFDAVYSILIIGVPFILSYVFLRKRKAIGNLPLGAPRDTKAATLLVFVGLAACIAGSYVSGLFTGILENLFHVTFTMPEDEIKYTTLPLILFGILKVSIVPALVEEFAIRGVVMQSLKKYGDWFAILMSAMVFALMHGNMIQIPFAFIAGIAIGYAVTVTGSMWTGVFIHALNNLFALIMQIIGDNCAESVQTILVLVLLAAVFVSGITCLVIYSSRYKKTGIVLSKGEGYLTNGQKAKTYIFTVSMILAILYLLIETAQYVEFNGLF